ncbi:hypothetical protein L3X38_003607 [Prunus dulcis]|uniref:Integrase catalytic domain-containing protein n=1 Tax=Prunus dulcis TaxID=3755 RepID=A0AAD5F263_PRUDU|nr:hypothetical protein L3X38_003607 [Prunus dulcis]
MEPHYGPSSHPPQFNDEKHMTGDKNWFESFVDMKISGSVTFGDGKKACILVKLCGEVKFNTKNCIVSDLRGKQVICAPRSKENCYCTSTDNSNLCLRAVDDQVELWHKRLGHVNYRDWLKLSKKSYVRGLPSLSGKLEGVCGGCQIGKQTRTAHSATTFIGTNRILELMHMDLVDFLVAKSNAFDSFSKICSKIQNEKNDKVVRLRTNHGTEFENASFHDFCNTNGIAHEFSAPITPQQNGVVEHKNRVLIEMGRVMLNAANLAKHFWAEANCTACYTLNRVYLKPNTSTTPYELWKGKQSNVSHLRIFGSICYIYKDRDFVAKFYARSDTVPQSLSSVKEASTIDHSDFDIQDHIATTVETSNTSSQVQRRGVK